jgi:hypothetical protein
MVEQATRVEASAMLNNAVCILDLEKYVDFFIKYPVVKNNIKPWKARAACPVRL